MKGSILMKYRFNDGLIDLNIHAVTRIFYKIKIGAFLNNDKLSCKTSTHCLASLDDSINVCANLCIIFYKFKLSKKFSALSEIGGPYHKQEFSYFLLKYNNKRKH